MNIKKEYKIFADETLLEKEALDQFESAMNQEFVIKGALMPDAHAGYTLPIGAVIATYNKILPAYIGFDIGCGMCSILTTFKKEDIVKNSDKIFNSIYRGIPVGFNHNKLDSTWDNIPPITDTGKKIFEKNGLKQLASLGGGNHFLEIGYDELNRIWITIHSGSRGIGHAIASYYMKLASGSNKAKDGHFGFNADSIDGKDYIIDLNFCLEFALENRKQMIQRAIKEISYYCDGIGLFETLINRNHNHAELKNDMWIHRKGATHADVDMLGVIPGNMRDGSFIVKGKGNPESLFSSSHGAGRVLSRKKASETLDINLFKEAMYGVKASVSKDTLDESPFAYKNIFDVMNLQKDLVEVLHYIKPLINIKG